MSGTKVKAGSITNLTDARYFAARGVEWLGFQLEAGASDFIPPVTVKAIKEWVDGVKIIGEFGFSQAAAIEEAVKSIGLDVVQAGMFSTPADLAHLSGTPVIKEVIVEKSTSESSLAAHLEEFAPFCEMFLLNFDKSGITWEDVQRGEPVSTGFLKTLCSAYKVILSMDFTSAIVRDILKQVNPHGLNVTGGEEEKVGFKSFDELDDIFDELELQQ